MKNIILGSGEVANAISKNLKSEFKMYDKDEWEELKTTRNEILHITIPYTENFKEIVKFSSYVFDPDVIIIHSTIKPGTSEAITDVGDVLYSPVIGRHADNFSDSIKDFTKFFAGKEVVYEKIKDEFIFDTEYWGEDKSELEFSKIMCTSRMYYELIYMKEMEKNCEEFGFDFENCYTKWTKNYNKGIEKKHKTWTRTLYDKMIDNIPGGHCLAHNIHFINNKISDFIKKYEKDLLYKSFIEDKNKFLTEKDLKGDK